MSIFLGNRIVETTTTTGTGSLSLAGAPTGAKRFRDATGGVNGDVFYFVVDSVTGDWEAGIGTLTVGSPDVLARTTVLANSAGTTAKITFGAGTKTVFLDVPSQHMVYLNAAKTATLPVGLLLADGSVACSGTLTAAKFSGMGATPIGGLMDFAGTAAPSGWLLCYGQAVSRTTYAALFAVLTTTHGAGDGSTTFNLPDYRGRTGFGKDNMGGTAANRITSGVSGVTGTTLGATGGSEALHGHSHTVTIDEGGDHAHSGSGSTASAGAHTHGQNLRPDGQNQLDMGFGTGGGASAWEIVSSAAQTVQAGYTQINTDSDGAHTHTVTVSIASGGAHTHTGSTAVTGSGGSQNLPPTVIVNKIIYAGV